MSKNIKILVVFHKKDRIYNSKIFLPIHAGRDIAEQKLKDGKLSKSEYDWLVKNLVGDNTGDNVSFKNSYINEMTAIYWAWKHYEEIGNPDFIGVNHYRRYFKINHSNILKYLKKYDFISLSRPNFPEGFVKQWEFCCKVSNFNISDMEVLLEVYKKRNFEDYEQFNQYMHGFNDGNMMNLFVMSKQDFFRYCEWIFPLIWDLEEHLSTSNRVIGMLAERLTAYYLWKLKQEGKREFKARLADVPPAFSWDYISSQIFSYREKVQTNGSRHAVLKILGLGLNIKLKKADIV